MEMHSKIIDVTINIRVQIVQLLKTGNCSQKCPLFLHTIPTLARYGHRSKQTYKVGGNIFVMLFGLGIETEICLEGLEWQPVYCSGQSLA